MNNRQTQTLRRSLSLFLECEMKAYEKIPKAEFIPSPKFQAKIEEYNRAVEDETSSAHKRIRWRMIGIAAVIVTAMLLCATACAVFYDEIAGFFAKKFDTHTTLWIPDSDAPKYIENAATLTFVPEEYVKERTLEITGALTTVWKKEGKSITFTQNTMNNFNHSVDTKDAECREIEMAGFKILQTHKNGIYAHVWRNDEYSFTLICPDSLSIEEIERIISGIQY